MIDHPDLDSLSKEELLDLIRKETEDGIQIDFAGKANTRQLARKVRPRMLKSIKRYSVGTEEQQARNVVIQGDNLQAMATLYRERGQIDLILTDPPYNTGNDFRYNDRWDDDPNDTGLGEFVSADDGARHTKWMRFMWPRLQMMRSMLKPGGVLAICIDHRELFRLGQMLDELFGEANRLAIINWQKSYTPRSDNRHISTATEYVLVYARDEEHARTGLLPRTAEMDARYKSPDGDRRRWKAGGLSGPKAKTHQSMVYAVQNPFTGELHYPPDNACWRPEQKDVVKALSEWGIEYTTKKLDDADIRAKVIGVPMTDVPDVKAVVYKGSAKAAKKAAASRLEEGSWPAIFFGKSGQGRPQTKNYLEDVKQGKVPLTFWADEDFEQPLQIDAVSWRHKESGHSRIGVDELSAVVGAGHGFETVKPLRLFDKIMRLWCPPSGRVLDPFAGSGTTGHVVLDANLRDGADRSFVLVEQGRPEAGDHYAKSLLAARLQRVVTGDLESGRVDGLPGGYRFFELKSKVDAEALLRMERDDLAATIIATHFDDRSRRDNLVTVFGDCYLVATNSNNEGFYLIWDGPDRNANFTEDVYEVCAAEAARRELAPIYHVYARLNLYQSDNVHFYQIPDRILADFGLDTMSEPFADTSA